MVKSSFPTTWKVTIEIKREGKYHSSIRERRQNAIASRIQIEK
jgi:hypothetical protein